MMFGIDISHWQGNFDMMRAKAEGAEFVIIKAGGGDKVLYKDSMFENNYAKAKACGLHIGAYFFAYCFDVEDAKREADHFMECIKGKEFDMPVYMDVEADVLKLSRRELTEVCKAFLNRLEEHGYFAGIYASTSVFNSEVYDSELKRYAHWIAQYATRCTYGGEIGMWQFGGGVNFLRDAKVAGVTCDQNFCYVDYPTIIKGIGYNGYKVEPEANNKINEYEEAAYMASEKRYNTMGEIVADFPWAEDDIKFLCDNAIILGNGSEEDEDGYPTDMDLDEDMIRMLLFNVRLTRKIIAATAAAAEIRN